MPAEKLHKTADEIRELLNGLSASNVSVLFSKMRYYL